MPDHLITSVHNPRVKDAARLRDRRQRDRQQRIIIDGARELARAVDAGVNLLEVFVCQDSLHTPDAPQALAKLSATSAAIWHVTPAVFAKLAFGHRAEGLLGVAETPRTDLANLKLATDIPLVAVLEGVEKPGNIGAVLRSADGAGVSALLVADGKTDLFNPNAIRASLGTIFTLPIAAAATADCLTWLRAANFQIIAARVGAERAYTDIDYRRPTAIVLGSEADGLSPAWQADGILGVQIPMRGAADSLNVSAAAAIMFYEAVRQRL